MINRDLSRYPDDVHSYSGIDQMLERDVPDGILTVDYGGSPLDLLHRPRGARTTVVVFHTALSPAMRTLPVFSGLGVTASLDVNVVCVSDPSLVRGQGLKLAWFAGSDRQPLQRDLPGVLAHVLRSHDAQDVVFFGASGGGYAAMYYSYFFPGSLALPLNPQVILKDYSDDALLAYARVCFGAEDLEEARTRVSERVTADLRDLYREGHSNTIAYLQNLQDTIHLYRHLTPFLRAVPRTSKIGLVLDRWGAGHVPPPSDVVAHALRTAATSDGDWSRVHKELGCAVAPEADLPVAIREGRSSVS